MAHNYTRSVAELRRESERTRAELSQTVESLRTRITDTATDIRHKASPEHIKAEVSHYVAGRSRHWFGNLKQQAMDNPMQALAAGTAVAVPAFKMMRSVPLPLVMIGAGLALASPRVRGAVADTVALNAPRGDTLNETATQAKVRAEGVMDDARSTIASKAAELSNTAAQVTGDARERTAELSGAAKDSLRSAKENLGSTMSAASDAAKVTLDTTRTRASERFNAARASAETMVRDHTALVGGLGLAIGALLAASLPSSKAERDTLGEASDTLRKTAADAATETFDEVKSATDKISEAEPGSQMRRATEDATEKLTTVADDTITTAFEPSQTDHR